LKERFPTCVIDILLSTHNEHCAATDPVISHRFVYHKTIPGFIRIVSTLRKNRYDVLVDCMDNVSASSTSLIALIAPKCAVGLDKENAFAYDIIVPRPSQDAVHIVDRLGELLRPFGIDPRSVDLSLEYVTTPAVSARAKQWMESSVTAPRVGINMFASSTAKSWGMESCRETIARLRRRFPEMSFVFFAAPSLMSAVAEFAMSMKAAVFPTGSFDDFAAGIRCCDVLITVDTSAVHLAAAYHIPAVVLYARKDATQAPWVPYRSPHRAVTTESATLADISSDAIVDAIIALEGEHHFCSVIA
jgi:ADP-heptose:LPS heptosyltransferase